MIKVGRINPKLIGDEFHILPYEKQPIKESEVEVWREQGYTHSKFTGAMYGSKNAMPTWVKDIAREIGLRNCGFTFYKMSTLEIMPPHVDHFDTYCRIFDKPRDRVYRAIVFLEDWKPGHYFEYNSLPFTGWKKGDYVLYSADIFHAASNIGTDPRYTLQITGTYEVLLSLEPRDTITEYYRANGSSPTWYTEEENRFTIPKMWGWWELFGSKNEEFSKRVLEEPDVVKDLVTPFREDTRVEYVPFTQIGEQKHIYMIYINTPTFFTENEKVGLSCISGKYKADLQSGKAKLVLFQPFEGDSGKEGNDDLEILEEWIHRESFIGENVYYVHGNLLISNLVKERNLSFNGVPYIYFDHTVKITPDQKPAKFDIQDTKYLFLCYGRMPRRHRVEFANRLLKEKLLDKGKISLGKFPAFGDLDFAELESLTPLEIDITLKYNLMSNLNLDHYSSTFISIVNETLVENDTIFFSEKTFKAIATGHPFMILGNKGSVGKLKSMGYRTFSKWIDERYDDESSYSRRIDLITEELNKLSTKSPEELLEIRLEMNEVLEHNQNHFREQIQQRYGHGGKFNPIIELLQKIY